MGAADEPPESSWPFKKLRHLDIVQADDFFVIAKDNVWVLPLRDTSNGMTPVSIWGGRSFDGIGFALKNPDWRHARWYDAAQVETLLRCVREFGVVLEGLAELQWNAEPATLVQAEEGVRRELADWIVVGGA